MNISFGSNYVVKQGRDFPQKVMSEIGNIELDGAKVYHEWTPFSEAVKTGVFSTYNISVPDEMDKSIEAMLISNGIDFHKSSKKEALDPENIKSRICVDPYFQDKCSLVEIDVDKFNELFKKDKISYIEPKGSNGIGNRYDDFVDFLTTGRKIHATRVCVNDYFGDVNVGIEDGRHRFAVLRDMGIKKLPVAMDKSSIEKAKKYGLI